MTKKTNFHLYGIFGFPLTHTLSPLMHEAAFVNHKIKTFYLPLELDSKNFQRTVKHIKKIPIQGFNITVPYKEEVMKALDHVDAKAKAIGAVNTAYRQGKRWLGTNTDVDGFLISLEKEANFNIRNKNAVVFGAGGSAKAVLYGLSVRGAKKIVLINRTKSRAQKILKHLKPHVRRNIIQVIDRKAALIAKVLSEADLVVNTTSLGLRMSDPAVIRKEWIPKRSGSRSKLFFDLIYNPAETPFLKEAKQKGHGTLNGLSMLLYQGVKAWEIWTRKKAPVAIMRKALYEAL